MSAERIERPFCYRDKEYITLSEEEHESVKQFIRKYFKPISTINEKSNSYMLKHLIENRIGFYLSNADCKKAMIECGYTYRPIKYCPINWVFNVSAKSIKEAKKIPVIYGAKKL